MTNEQLRATKPVWKESVDTGGMFTGRLSVHHDPEDGNYLAVAKDDWGGGKQGRREHLEVAKMAAHTFARELWG